MAGLTCLKYILKSPNVAETLIVEQIPVSVARSAIVGIYTTVLTSAQTNTTN
jgi:hypothetical protein